jgi:hypothetical protein
VGDIKKPVTLAGMRVKAINHFFNDPDNGSPKLTMEEHKALSKEERQDIGDQCIDILGWVVPATQ